MKKAQTVLDFVPTRSQFPNIRRDLLLEPVKIYATNRRTQRTTARKLKREVKSGSYNFAH